MAVASLTGQATLSGLTSKDPSRVAKTSKATFSSSIVV